MWEEDMVAQAVCLRMITSSSPRDYIFVSACLGYVYTRVYIPCDSHRAWCTYILLSLVLHISYAYLA
jgi:hypothetical protein